MKYRLIRDLHGYAKAIARGNWTILQLIPGTERNEENAKKIVDRLNKQKTEDKRPPKNAKAEAYSARKSTAPCR